MAINVDTVYKTVLLILNKEQRGYITPDEFNKTATQVQLDIFEQYFDDLNQQLRVPQADCDYTDRQMNIDEKISYFKAIGSCVYNASGGYWQLPASAIGSSTFNIRYSTETSADEIKSKITDIIKSEDIEHEITWKHSGEPFLTTDKEFMNICKQSIKSTTNQDAIVSTNGGTSDGRFMAKVCDGGQRLFVYNPKSLNSGPLEFLRII